MLRLNNVKIEHFEESIFQSAVKPLCSFWDFWKMVLRMISLRDPWLHFLAIQVVFTVVKIEQCCLFETNELSFLTAIDHAQCSLITWLLYFSGSVGQSLA